MKKILLASFAAVLFGVMGVANAHLTAFGWKDNGNGTVTMFGQHWHGDQSMPSTDNGGIHIGVVGTNAATWLTFQWTGFFNNQGGTLAGLGSMVTAGTLTGFQVDAVNNNYYSGENDWFYTAPLVIGNGTWGMFTGTNCCIDTMSAPGQFTITGVTSVNPGTGPGVVPEPASVALLGLGLVGLVAVRRRKFSA